jgi:MFS family permease
MLWQMASYADMGIYTGLYYFFSQLASIVAPPITGGFIDLFGFRAIFLFAAVCMLIAFLLMGGVTRGEASEGVKQ